MNRNLLLLCVLLSGVTGIASTSRASNVAFEGYVASVDGISGAVRTFGQLLVHRRHEVRLSDAARHVPILSVQFAGQHYQQAAADDPKHGQARAKCIAERLVHAWTLMDHGATLEVATDDWVAYAVRPNAAPPRRTAIFVRNPIPGEEPLRVLTVYPEDLARYPWISSERSLAEYLTALLQAHYLLFWKNESNISKYADLRIGKTSDGRVFREIAVRALEAAKARGTTQLDDRAIRDALAVMPFAQRDTLCRLAVVPPTDWESASE